MKTLFSMAILCFSSSALAQTVTDLTPSAGGAYAMKIDGRPYVAIAKAQSDEMIRAVQQVAELKQRLAKAEEDLTKYRALGDSYDQLRKDYTALIDKYKVLTEDSLKLGEKYSEAAGKLVTLNGDYRKLVSDYDALAAKYRSIALRSAPRQPFDVGAGVVRAADTNHTVLMVGAGREIVGDVGVRAWLFGGQSTYGVMLGVSF